MSNIQDPLLDTERLAFSTSIEMALEPLARCLLWGTLALFGIPQRGRGRGNLI